MALKNIEESSEMFSQLCFGAQNIYTANEQYLPYHSWEHVRSAMYSFTMLHGHFDSAIGSTARLISLDAAIALLYHDIVYVPGNETNETLSARTAERHLLALKARYPTVIEKLNIPLIKALIELTAVRCHLMTDAELLDYQAEKFNGLSAETQELIRQLAPVVLDADLSSLAAPWERFVDNQRAIIFEQTGLFAHEQRKEHDKASAEFLLKLASAREKIFRTEDGRWLFEQRAWENITEWHELANSP